MSNQASGRLQNKYQNHKKEENNHLLNIHFVATSTIHYQYDENSYPHDSQKNSLSLGIPQTMHKRPLGTASCQASTSLLLQCLMVLPP